MSEDEYDFISKDDEDGKDQIPYESDAVYWNEEDFF